MKNRVGLGLAVLVLAAGVLIGTHRVAGQEIIQWPPHAPGFVGFQIVHTYIILTVIAYQSIREPASGDWRFAPPTYRT